MRPIPHGGDFTGTFLDFSASVSPLGVPAGVKRAILSAMGELPRYPDPESRRLRAALARRHGRREGEILVTNGSTEAISLVFRALKPTRTGIFAPAYRDPERAARQVGSEVYFLKPGSSVRGLGLVYLGSPNNPTGQVASRTPLSGPTTWLVDETFLDFSGGASLAEGRLKPNVLVLRSFTKFYSLPGLRLGYVVGPARLIERLGAQAEPWSVNALAQAAGIACLKEGAYARRLKALIRSERARLSNGLKSLGFRVLPSQANFLLVFRKDARRILRKLERKGILLRDASDFPGLGQGWIRIAVRTKVENGLLLRALAR